MRIFPLRNLLLLAALVSLVSCAVPPGPAVTPGTGDKAAPVAVKSDLQRVKEPQSNPEDLAALSAGNRAFAFDLYHQISSQPGNLFYSPYSISLALAMLEAGARSSTLTEMDTALHFDLPQERLHLAFNALDQALHAKAEQVVDPSVKPFQLNIANALWGQKDYAIEQAYLDLLAQNYGAGMRLIDFAADPEGARQAINDWVAEQTEQKIKDVVPQGSITDLTRLVLANAIYFNASWLEPFHEESTKQEDFHLLDGSTVQAPMMHTSRNMAYVQGDGFQMVELPYVATSLVMDVLVPDAGQFEAVESGLSAEMFDQATGQIGYTQVQLGLPKFSYEASFNLSEPLKALGMQDAFVPGKADLTGISAAGDLYVQDVVHKAFVAVDEAGTEAAAATVVMMGTTSMPLEPVTLTIDRPFLFVIRDTTSGTLLFVGRVLQP